MRTYGIKQKEHRYGLSLILDYTSDLVDIKFYNVFDQKSDSNITRDYTNNFDSNGFLYQIFINETKTKQRTHSLQALFKIGNTELPYQYHIQKGSKIYQTGSSLIFYNQIFKPFLQVRKYMQNLLL